MTDKTLQDRLRGEDCSEVLSDPLMIADALDAAQEWREAVLNELIVAHIYTKEHDTNPRKAVQDAITWNCQVAIDPAVSTDAQKLIAAAQEALAKEKERAEKFRWQVIDTCKRAEAAERERDRYKREHEADKTGQLISYLNVLAQENKTLRRMSHVDRAEKAERERDEWKRKAEESARVLAEIVDAWDNGREDDSIIASRRVTDAFNKARAAIAAKGEA